MHQPDADAVRTFLDRSKRRALWLRVGEGVAAGFLAACIFSTLVWPQHSAAGTLLVAAICGIAGGAVSAILTRLHGHSLAGQIEQRTARSRNLLFTANELLTPSAGAHPGALANTPSEYITSLVFRDASAVVRSLDLKAVFPARRAVVGLLIGTLAVGLLTLRTASPAAAAMLSAAAGPTDAVVDEIDVNIVPPSYAGLAARTEHDPTRIQVLAGSEIKLSVRARAKGLTVETLQGRQQLKEAGKGLFSATIAADEDGYLALEPSAADGTTGARRLIGLSVTVDAPPRVRIVKPGKDIRMLDGNQTLDIAIESEDDIGLASLLLRYTKVSGSGENFTFVDGEVPIAVVRTDATHWKANVQWRLNALALEAGDVVVYRAVAADKRPGALPTESDSYLAEVIAPGSIAGGGFDIDTDMERYALSEQMVILKSERLLANKKNMAADSFADAASDLGIEQRSVRAEFVFMMGGEISAAPTSMTMLDEEGEAEGESDLAAGYSRNQGREALMTAIRAMSRASGSLIDANVPDALVAERTALAQLEKAFSHTHILLRALSEHERLDMTRRQTGPVADAAREDRPVMIPEVAPALKGLRQALGSIAAFAARTSWNSNAATQTSVLAESVLRIDPSSKRLQQIAALLTDAATSMRSADHNKVHQQLDQAATALAALLRAGLPASPAVQTDRDAGRLNGALIDALRKGGR